MKALKFVALLLVVAAAFGGGYVWRATRAAPVRADARKVLYWVDPMHPAYRSDRPGIAPDAAWNSSRCSPMTRALPRRRGRSSTTATPPIRRTRRTGGPQSATGHTLEPVYAPEAPLAPAAGTVRIPTSGSS